MQYIVREAAIVSLNSQALKHLAWPRWRINMVGNFEDLQNSSNINIDATWKRFGAFSTGAQSVATEIADYSKRSFENGTKVIETLCSVRSIDKAIEVQTEYAKNAYGDYTAQLITLGRLYADMAREACKPVEDHMAKMSFTK
jgi:hypothetical protein